PTDLLERVGAVSAEVAEAMARGALARFDVAHVTVAVTGIAGPDGGSPGKPVGLTFVAAALRDGNATVERHEWPFDRDGNKRASALAALRLASRMVSEA
ncbi:MAG TPA: CinA family protein, partial [Candidatus Limnocylindria bacterium]|nr:CinA family protein [Candidatus Limnocylindria bacterium]